MRMFISVRTPMKASLFISRSMESLVSSPECSSGPGKPTQRRNVEKNDLVIEREGKTPRRNSIK